MIVCSITYLQHWGIKDNRWDGEDVEESEKNMFWSWGVFVTIAGCTYSGAFLHFLSTDCFNFLQAIINALCCENLASKNLNCTLKKNWDCRQAVSSFDIRIATCHLCLYVRAAIFLSHSCLRAGEFPAGKLPRWLSFYLNKHVSSWTSSKYIWFAKPQWSW